MHLVSPKETLGDSEENLILKLVKCTNFCNNTSQLIHFINRVSPYILHEFLRVSTFVFIYSRRMNVTFIQTPKNSMVHTMMQWNC